jgi:hypothetical protein
MPATAEPEGYSAEKAKGNLQSIAGSSTWRQTLSWAHSIATMPPKCALNSRALA